MSELTSGQREQLRRTLAQIDATEQVRRRAVQQMIDEATGAFWRRRAQVFEDARPRPGDFVPPGVDEADARAAAAVVDERLAGVVQACQIHAALIGSGYFADEDLEEPSEFPWWLLGVSA